MTKYENRIVVCPISPGGSAVEQLNDFIKDLGQDGYMVMHLHEFGTQVPSGVQLNFMIVAVREIIEN